MNLTPGVYKKQFEKLFQHNSNNNNYINLSFIERELYLNDKFKDHLELERYLRHDNIIDNPEFVVDDNGDIFLTNYEYIGSNSIQDSFVKRAINNINKKILNREISNLNNTNTIEKANNQLNDIGNYGNHLNESIEIPEQGNKINENEKNKQRKEKNNQRKEKRRNLDSLERRTVESSYNGTNISFVTQSDLDIISRHINSMQSEFQNHGDKMYSAIKKQEDYLKRMEKINSAANENHKAKQHIDWLEQLDFDEISTLTKKSILKKILYSNMSDTLKMMSDILYEEDGRKHNLLLTIDALHPNVKVNAEEQHKKLENRSIWSNSNRGDYSFQLHDEIGFLGFGDNKIVSSKTKIYDTSNSNNNIKDHLKK